MAAGNARGSRPPRASPRHRNYVHPRDIVTISARLYQQLFVSHLRQRVNSFLIEASPLTSLRKMASRHPASSAGSSTRCVRLCSCPVHASPCARARNSRILPSSPLTTQPSYPCHASTPPPPSRTPFSCRYQWHLCNYVTKSYSPRMSHLPSIFTSKDHHRRRLLPFLASSASISQVRCCE